MDMNEELRLQQGDVPTAVRKKNILLKGRPAKVDSIVVNGKEMVISGGLLRTAKLLDEWYEDVEDPKAMLEAIRKSNLKADLFTFWQRLPETTPQYRYYMECESIAALTVKSFDCWWTSQINPKTRNLIRKSEKMGVDVRQARFDEEFIRGMADIFNETPIRQGKPFWHYGKDAETIKREFARFLFREDIFGAYVNGELIGFIFLAYAGKYALLGQIISKISHREKAPNNALIAKAVEICSKKNIPYLVYASWVTGSLGDFKRHNGFQKFDLPRYYIPLTIKGHVILKFHLHHGIAGLIPEQAKQCFSDLRKNWYFTNSSTSTSIK
jgi:hypothetical protein